MDGKTDEQAIRRLIRRRDTREYCKGDGWTKNPNEAATFCDVVEATQFCIRHGLTDVELALRVQAEASDVFCTAIR